MILFDHVISTAARDGEPNAIGMDCLQVEWNELLRRAIRKTSRDGNRVGVLLPRGVVLQHRDVVGSTDGHRLLIELLPCEVLVTSVTDHRQSTLLAWALGNLHMPVAIDGSQLITVDDGPAVALLDKAKIPFTRELRRFRPDAFDALPAFALSRDFSSTRG